MTENKLHEIIKDRIQELTNELSPTTPGGRKAYNSGDMHIDLSTRMDELEHILKTYDEAEMAEQWVKPR